MSVTQHNTFVRKFGNKAIVITVTDWSDYESLMDFAEADHDNPDFIVGASTTRTIYSNMLPATTVNVLSAKDITEETQGFGIAGILTGSSPAGPFWSFRKVEDPLLGGLIAEEKDIVVDEKTDRG